MGNASHAVITGHGSDNNNCAEFCVTTHVVTVSDIDFAQPSFNVTYVGLFNGVNPNPQPQTNMPYIIAHIYVVFS